MYFFFLFQRLSTAEWRLLLRLIFILLCLSPQVPRMVEGLTSHHCSQIAAAKDHTVVLTEEGYVYTFGLNTFHQLGLAPPPASAHVPKQVEFRGKSKMMPTLMPFSLNWASLSPMDLGVF